VFNVEQDKLKSFPANN